MTCEWAEGFLSAYLDDALDPQTRAKVGAHVEQCPRCQTLLDEYRQYDQLLRDTPPIQPADHLRERIFTSPEFAALTQRLADEDLDHGEPSASSATPPPTRRTPLYVRALIPAAALLTISLGAGLLYREGLLPHAASSTSAGQGATLAGPGDFSIPLAAGPRVVFLRAGALWSVAQRDANTGQVGAPQRLTPDSVQVVAWSVAPLNGASGAARIAYIDGRTGSLHLIHSDGQADTLVAAVSPTQTPAATFWSGAAGRAALAGLAWSPNGARLAFTSATATGAMRVEVYTAGGSATTTVATAPTGATLTRLTWRADGQALAFVSTASAAVVSPSSDTTASSDAAATGAQTILVWRAGQATQALRTATGASGAIAQMNWSGAALTWAETSGGAVTGVYVAPQGTSGTNGTLGAASALTPAGARYSTAAFSAAHGGAWLLADGALLSEAPLDGASAGPQVAQVAQATDAIHSIAWSPDGGSAALVAGDTLSLWQAADGLRPLASGVAATPAPVWSPDGASVAVTQGRNVIVVEAPGAQGQAAQVVATLPTTQGSVTLAWSPDGRMLAIAEAQGTLLVSRDGLSQTLVTSRAAQDGALAWSLAG